MLDIYNHSLSFEEFAFVIVAAIVTTYIHIIYNSYEYADVIIEERWYVILGVFVLHLVVLSLWMLW